MSGILKHLLFWLGVFCFSVLVDAHDGDYRQSLLVNSFNVVFYAAAYYLLRYVQLPLFHRRRFWLFGASLLATSLLFAQLCSLSGYYVIGPYLGYQPRSIWMSLAVYPAKIVRFYSPAVALLAFQNYRKQQVERVAFAALQREKLQTELKYLKAQLHPHFLFNTLNNLYAYVLTNHPDAPDMVLRLSEILDYTIYRSQEQEVPLEEELNLVGNYLALERIRCGNRLDLEFDQTATTTSIEIAPLLLLSVVENAFKHGVHPEVGQAKVRIRVSTDTSGINVRVSNTYPDNLPENEPVGGVGLRNVERQLELTYADCYQLSTHRSEGWFHLSLYINSLTHVH